MTIFKEKVSEEYLTTAETKEILADLEMERAADEEREMRYELKRSIEHVNHFAMLDVEESLEFVEQLRELEKVDEATAYKIGMLRIQAIRAKAESALGAEFEIRDFHDQVLGSGQLPMAMLEAKIDAWVAAQL